MVSVFASCSGRSFVLPVIKMEMVINPKTWWKSIVGEEGAEADAEHVIVPEAVVEEKAEAEGYEDPEHFEEPADYEDEEEFDTAYDLEEGSPFQATRPAEHIEVKPQKSTVSSAKEFFLTEVIYRFDVLDESEQKLLAGKYCFELKGQNGGIWTVNIGDELEVANRKEKADSVIQMKQSDFVHLTNGDLNPQMGVMANKIKLSGDIDKALAINRILVPEAD